MHFQNASSRTIFRLRARVLCFLCLCVSPNIWSAELLDRTPRQLYPAVFQATTLAASLGMQEDPDNGVTLKPTERRFDSGRAVFGQKPAASLGLRMIRGEVAVLLLEGHRETVGIGDRFGKEKYLVLAIREDRIFFQAGSGFGLVYRNKDGMTVFELINRAHLPPDVLELAPKPQ